MSPVTTYEAAIARALDWAEGRLSHNNMLLTAERNPDDRAVTLALIEFADAQEVVKWSALATALIAGEEAVKIAREALAVEPEYEWRAMEDDEMFPTGTFSEKARAEEWSARIGGYVQRRIKAGPWERVEG